VVTAFPIPFEADRRPGINPDGRRPERKVPAVAFSSNCDRDFGFTASVDGPSEIAHRATTAVLREPPAIINLAFPTSRSIAVAAG
jgi:hypothetical protein